MKRWVMMFLCLMFLMPVPVKADILSDIEVLENALGIDNSDKPIVERVSILEEQLGISETEGTLIERLERIEKGIGISDEVAVSGEKEEKNKNDDEEIQERISRTKESLRPYISMLGIDSIDGNIDTTQSFLDNINKVFVMGYTGEITHGLGDESKYVIVRMDWMSNETVNESEYKAFLNDLAAYYEAAPMQTQYENLTAETCWVWKDKDNDVWVTSWLENNRIFMCWWLENGNQAETDIESEQIDDTNEQTKQVSEAITEEESDKEDISLDNSDNADEPLSTARQIELVFQQVIDNVHKDNEGKTFGDEFVECDRMYLSVYNSLNNLQGLIDNGRSLGELKTISENLFGKTPSSIEEIQGWYNNMYSYMVGKEGRYLDGLMSKFKTLSTVEGTIEPTTVDITINDMDAFLDELIVSPEAFGKIWAVTDLYAGKTQFTDDGFSFQWNAGGEFQLDLDALKEVEETYSGKELILHVQEGLNALGYECGTPDGVAGQKTQSAVSAYRKDHGMSENVEITQDLLGHINSELAYISSNDIEIDKVMDRVVTLPVSTPISVSDPIKQDGLIGYVVRYNGNQIHVMCNPENDGKTTIAIYPYSLTSENAILDYMDFLGFMVNAVEEDISGYEAYGIALQALDLGHYVHHGIEYELNTDDSIMFISY